MKTFMRRLGNKSRYLKYILPHIPESYNTYIEPFVGSGALFLKLEPHKYIINDINKDVINIWRTVKKSPDVIINYFKDFDIKFRKLSNENKEKYCRQLLKKLDALDFNNNRASLYLLITFCSFMGIIIRNNKFYFVGLDKYYFKNSHNIYFLSDQYYQHIKDINEYLINFQGKIYNKDYAIILEKATKDDFVYLDPPYVEDHNYQFNYNTNEFTNSSFLNELHHNLKKLDHKKVKWLMTQADTPIIRKIFKKYNITTFQVYRNSSNTYKTELVIKNF